MLTMPTIPCGGLSHGQTAREYEVSSDWRLQGELQLAKAGFRDMQNALRSNELPNKSKQSSQTTSQAEMLNVDSEKWDTQGQHDCLLVTKSIEVGIVGCHQISADGQRP